MTDSTTQHSVPADRAPRAPSISVIIPVFNVADYVRPCLTSLRRQTFLDFEAIVIDDGSTDDSAAQARAAIDGDPRFTLIEQENRGLSGARNTGLDLARGASIAFVDGDDRVASDYLAQLWQTLNSSGADWVACALRACYADGTGTEHSAIHGSPDLFEHPAPQRFSLDDWSDVIRHFPSAWNKLYRRALIDGLRFDEGTWFEDHSFFLRVAARTDHIYHLPQPLYLQTQGRPGQITTQDDDRVFEQFDVLRGMRALMENSPRPGANQGFARITSRLLFERSTALKDPKRRAQFATQSQQFLQEQRLVYTPDWDRDIARSWGLEIAGQTPLSVVLPWNGKDHAALQRTLASVTDQFGPGREVLVICDSAASAKAARKTAELWPLAQVHQHSGRGPAMAWQFGLNHAQGLYVMFLSAGDVLHPATLQYWTETALRHDADFTLSDFRRGSWPEAPIQTSLYDTDLQHAGPMPSGLAEITGSQALRCGPHLQTRLFKKAFLQDQSLSFSPRASSDWAFALAAALVAKRAVHIPWPGIGLSRFDHKNGSDKGVGGTFDDLIRALPQSATHTLPKGWQRRIFARIMRERIDTDLPQGPRKLPALALMATGAMRRGFGGSHRDPAGFDTNIGPKMTQILNPLSLLGRPALVPHPSDEQASPVPMHIFPLKGHGFARFRVDFQNDAYANLSFRVGKGPHIALHLSLRVKEQQVVFNDTHPSGQWRAERSRPYALKPRGHTLEIDITPPNVRVMIDGEEVFDISRRLPWRRSGVLALDQITHVEQAGGLFPTDLVPQEPGETLHLDSRLMLRAARYSDDTTITCNGIPLLVTAAPMSGGRAGLAAQPTGQIWVSGKDSVEFELSDGGSLSLTKEEMVARILRLFDQGLDKQDTTLATQVLEHIKLGELMPLMPKTAQQAAINLSYSLSLSKYLMAVPSEPQAKMSKATSETGSEEHSDQTRTDSHAETQADPPSKTDATQQLTQIDPTTSQVNTAMARFTNSQTMTPPADPARILAELQLPKEARRQLFLNLTELFCSDGYEFETLYQAAKADDLHGFFARPGDDAWAASAMVPYMLLNGEADSLKSVLWDLAKRTDGWVLTSTLSWTMRKAQTLPGFPADLRANIIYAWMDFVSTQAQDYWKRAQCLELIRTATWLVKHLKRDDYLKDDLRAFCLKNYGMSRVFWQELQNISETIPAHFTQAHGHFQTLLDQADLTAMDRALCFFDAAGNPDAARMRTEVLGPTSNDTATAPYLADTHNPSRAAVRHMAFPGSAPITPELTQMARSAVVDLYPQIPRAKNLDGQISAAKQIEAALNSPTADATTGPDADRLQALTPFIGSGDGFLGIGLALSLLAARLEHPDYDHTALLDWINDQIATLPDWEQDELPDCAALVSPLARLARHDDEAIKRLCSRLKAPKPPENFDQTPSASPLYDTIVTVFSCRGYLEDRIPALRDTWLTLLEALGVPYVIIVGDGEGQQVGDVLYLDAPDDYEGLPQKTLATIKWVHEQTPYAHMLKIDDDCFLNAPLFFQSLTYRKHHYYGRKLIRTPGQTDRAWHQEKSASPRGKLELDKSPEPSSYADGGSSYVLSRTAMSAALDAADSPTGKRLIASSFMEDKMLGDLLALRGIHIAEQDYRIAIRRRNHKTALPVSTWLNSFLPSRNAPVCQVHLDSHHDLPRAMQQLQSDELRPRKIWPSFQDIKLGYQSNALELVSSETSVQAARDADVAVVACMRNEMFMLPHFLAHYRRLGVGSFLIADNCSDDGTLEYLAEQPDVALFSVDTDYKLSAYGVAWQQALIAAFRMHKWTLVADADELLVWQENQTQTLPELVQSPEFDGAEAARVFMLDMYPKGPLEQANFASGDPFAEAGFSDSEPFLTGSPMRGPYCNAPAWTSSLRHRLIPGSAPNFFAAQKLALLRYHPFMRFSAGMHFVSDARLAKQELIFGHFKYNAAFRAKAATEVARGQHWGNAAEYRRYLALASEGRSVIYDPQRSVPWTQSPFVKARLKAS
ncbi:MAG: glycosyltransferase [Pelagimonas sp.]|uniref:glycosyltransferase n=1 Tax=Pelagimonas sp. TaxID=2073170 RepID=UPI003D6C3112